MMVIAVADSWYALQELASRTRHDAASSDSAIQLPGDCELKLLAAEDLFPN